MKLSAQTLALAAIGIADLVSTLLFVGLANAAEANPLMARFLEHGPVTFIQAKLILLLVPLAVIEVARRKRPVFVARAANLAIAAYVGLYVLGVARMNANTSIHNLSTARTTQEELQQQRKLFGLPPAPPLSIIATTAAKPKVADAAPVEESVPDVVSAVPASL